MLLDWVEVEAWLRWTSFTENMNLEEQFERREGNVVRGGSLSWKKVTEVAIEEVRKHYDPKQSSELGEKRD